MAVGYSSAVSQHLGTKAVHHPGGPRLDAAQCLLLCHSAAAVPHRDAGSQCVLHNTPVARTEGVGVQPHCLGLPQEIQQLMMLCSRQVRVLLRCIPRYLKLETP